MTSIALIIPEASNLSWLPFAERLASTETGKFPGFISYSRRESMEKQAAAILEHTHQLFPEEKGIVCIAHSLTVFPAVQAAILEPDLFRSLILLCPAGLYQQSPFKLLTGLARVSLQDLAVGSSAKESRSTSTPTTPASLHLAVNHFCDYASDRLVAMLGQTSEATKIWIVCADKDPLLRSTTVASVVNNLTRVNFLQLAGIGHNVYLWYESLARQLDDANFLA